MLGHRLAMIAAVMLLAGLSTGEASAIEPGRVLGVAPQPPNCVATPHGVSAGIPTPYRCPGAEQASPWYGYGFGVPTYNWGWFGVKYRPAVTCHRGYYGDFYQWGYRQGY